MGDGGSVLSHNTSFTGCHTPSSPNADDTRHNQHFTIRTEITSPTTPNHVFTLCTFKQCTASGRGGAIYAFENWLNLRIETCSFHACSAGYSGGAVCVLPPSMAQYSFSLSSSSFVGCSSSEYGGSVSVGNISVLSISKCEFLDSTSRNNGGALYFLYCPFGASSGLSHTLFQNCTQTSSGGCGAAVSLILCDSHNLSFVQFRRCSSSGRRGHDIYLRDTPLASNSFSTCDSTSSNTRRVMKNESNTFTDYSSLLPDPKFEATVTSFTLTQTGDDTVTLTLTLDKAVSGTMILIVSNVEGTRQEVAGKAPKIGRVLVFSFSSPSSTVGTCSSTVGESGVLQQPLSDYKLLAASMSNYDASVRSILNTSCELDESGTEVELSFSGFGIPEGLCTLTLNNSITLEVSFHDDSFGRSEGSVVKGVSGKDGELSEKTDYSLTGIVSQGKPTASIVIASGVVLSVPEAARLSKVSVSGFVDARKTTVKLSFESVRLEKNKKYILKMKLTDTSEDAITREVWTDGNEVLAEANEILYPFETSAEGRKEQLEFGVSYGVLSLTASDCTRSVLISDIVITLPAEPSRLVKIVSEDDDGLNSTTLTLSSRVLIVGVQYEMKVTGTPLSSASSSSNSLHETSIKFTATSATLNTVRLTLYPLEEADVKYGHSYCVDWMKVVDGAFILVETESCGFETPKELSRIISCSCVVLNKERSKVTISLEGRALAEPLGSIWVSVEDSFWESLSMRRVSETLCEADFLVASEQSDTHLKYEGEYTVCVKPDEASNFLVDSGITVLIPPPPRITSLDCVFVNSLQSMCKIRVSGTDLVVGTEHEVVLDDSIRLTVTFNTSTEGESEGVSIGKNGKLNHNTTYTLTEVKAIREDDGLILLPETVLLRIRERTVIRVIVREGGSSEVSECGTIGNACESVLVGWRVRESEGVSGVVVKIDGRVGFGGRVVVGEKKVEIGGLFEGENELKVSAGDVMSGVECGVVSVSGGRVVIVGVVLIVPSGWEMGRDLSSKPFVNNKN
ncbi:hypothetical protein BLNAU_17158 [Blattamonas nauphoetae]|uniref:Uncharacterized protein n=1 Tax=Blattamonas nauphoetae TaxID=2049346 RepID=A0ABQ9X7P0_9EUKA|nr:hypothetical protein BLNAU_17158 [Blattamonas nauphoetae]